MSSSSLQKLQFVYEFGRHYPTRVIRVLVEYIKNCFVYNIFIIILKFLLKNFFRTVRKIPIKVTWRRIIKNVICFWLIFRICQLRTIPHNSRLSIVQLHSRHSRNYLRTVKFENRDNLFETPCIPQISQ